MTQYDFTIEPTLGYFSIRLSGAGTSKVIGHAGTRAKAEAVVAFLRTAPVPVLAAYGVTPRG